MKNIKLIIVIIIILGMILSGAIYYTVSTDEESIEDDSQPQPIFDNTTDAPVFSNPPDGITETDSGLQINAEDLIDSHTGILNSNNAVVERVEDTSNITITKDNDYIHKVNNNINREKFSTENYTLVKSEDTYSAENTSIDSELYLYENDLERLLNNLSVASYKSINEDLIKLTMESDDNDLDVFKNRYNYNSINEITVDFEITKDGLIEDVDLYILGEKDNIRDSESKKYSVAEVSDTQLSQPNWVDNAKETSSIVQGRYDIQNGWILVEHNGLATIPEGEEITIRNLEDNTEESMQLDRDLSEGSNLGLILLDSGEWFMTINETPPEGESQNIPGYEITAGDENNPYFQITVRG